MAGVIEIRDVRIGEGIPKIIVPIVEKTKNDILKAAETIKLSAPDIVEWRVDWFDEAHNVQQVKEVVELLRTILGETLLLFTFRTKKEGGEKSISPDQYAALNVAVAATKWVDMVDVELLIDGDMAKTIVDQIHKTGVKVVVSNHDFFKTPDKDELVKRMKKMVEIGADIPKIAVMPNNKKDVLCLLSATEEMSASLVDHPIITMSMGADGLISRLCGEVFGSSCTFGAVGKVSAPGQMDAKNLRIIVEQIHHSM